MSRVNVTNEKSKIFNRELKLYCFFDQFILVHKQKFNVMVTVSHCSSTVSGISRLFLLFHYIFLTVILSMLAV